MYTGEKSLIFKSILDGTNTLCVFNLVYVNTWFQLYTYKMRRFQLTPHSLVFLCSLMMRRTPEFLVFPLNVKGAFSWPRLSLCVLSGILWQWEARHFITHGHSVPAVPAEEWDVNNASFGTLLDALLEPFVQRWSQCGMKVIIKAPCCWQDKSIPRWAQEDTAKADNKQNYSENSVRVSHFFSSVPNIAVIRETEKKKILDNKWEVCRKIYPFWL